MRELFVSNSHRIFFMREALLSAANYSELLQLKIIHKVKMMNFKKLRNSLAEELVESTALYEEMSIPPQPNAPPSESIIRFNFHQLRNDRRLQYNNYFPCSFLWTSSLFFFNPFGLFSLSGLITFYCSPVLHSCIYKRV